MKTLFGAVIVAGSGKLGGHVASKNRGGSYMRTKVTPSNPKSPDQTLSRNRLSAISTAWRALSIAQVAAWNAAASSWKGTNIFGGIVSPSGFNLFQKLNNNLVQIGEPIITAPPSPAAVPVIITGVLAAVHEGAVTVTFTTDPIVTASKIVVSATPTISKSQSFAKNKFCQIGVMPAIVDHVATLTTLYNARFTAVGSAANKLFVQLVQIVTATGQAGIPVTYECEIS